MSQPTQLPPLPTETGAPTEAPTETIVWFPPTATFTPLPSVTPNKIPTPDTRAVFGELILQDDFSQPENWTTGKMTAGSVVFGKNELSLGVSQPEGYLYSLREDAVVGDFYLEITASPSICRSKDEYGVLFRVSPGLDFFRFGLNCAGEARVDRFLAGSASSPQPPTVSGVVPPGAPSSSRIGIWANGREIRFYVNNEYLFMIHDQSLPSGGLGVYARAAGPDEMSVNFSELAVYDAQS